MMRSAVTKRPQKRRTIKITTPAPYLGLNTSDALSDMDPRYAVSLQNWIATPQGPAKRAGTRVWSTGLPGDVTTLMPFHALNSNNSKLFAASVSGFYDVTTGGAVGAPVVSGLNASSPYWQFANQASSGVNFLMCVNASDAPRLYNGTTWTTTSQAASPGFGQFANVDNNGNAVNINAFTDVTLHQRRLWFTNVNSTKAYYTNVDTPTGALFAFDFGPEFPRGGKLHKLASWSMNTGGTQGLLQSLVAISDRGDVVIYQGNDPSSSTTWARIAAYELGAPCGRRCVISFEADLLYLSRDGLYPMSKYVESGDIVSTNAITTKISNVVGDLIDTFGGTPGFEMAKYPGKNILLLNIPQSSTASNFQFCFNTVTNGWSQFTGWGAACWGLFNNALFYGGTNQVVLSFIGSTDGADINGVGGNNIIATGMGAFSEMDKPGVLKHAQQVKPYLVTGVTNPTIRVGVNVDFNLVPIVGSATLNPATGAVWDNAIWDSTSTTWVGSLTTYNQWSTPLCYPGDSLAFTLSVSAPGEVTWTKTGWLIELADSAWG
jgi:hypothetical protein